MCNPKTSGRTYKVITVQEAKTRSGYKCTAMGSTQESSTNETWKEGNVRCAVPSVLKLLEIGLEVGMCWSATVISVIGSNS